MQIEMKYRYLILTLACLFAMASCKKVYEMIDAQLPSSGNSASAGWFVKTDGKGSGTSWDDAMSPKSFRSKLYSGSFPSGSEIYFAGGTYLVGETAEEFLSITSGITIRGGYAPGSSGYSTDITYPTAYETVFSGDLNGNGVADEGDARLMEISSAVPAVFYGISFKHGYMASPQADERSGIFLGEGAHAKFYWCRFEENKCATEATGSAGGAALAIMGGRVDLTDCTLCNNVSASRGGAVRMLKSENYSGKLLMDRCLVSGNTCEADYGSAIQSSSDKTDIYIHNCTFSGNHAASGAAVNTPGNLVILSSTFADNLCTNGAKGHELRLESDGLVHIFNSIFVESKGTSGPSICVQNAANAMTSSGRNIITSVGGNGTFTQSILDEYGVTYKNVFGENVLADNGGTSMTIAPGTKNWNKATLGEIRSFATIRLVPFLTGIDQRGMGRTGSVVFPGACEKCVDSDTGDDGPVGPDQGEKYLYFKPGGNGDGSSWDSPYGESNLRFLINDGHLEAGAKLLLAAGKYLCGSAANVSDQSALTDHIRVASSLQIIGGYPANITGKSADGADPAANPTILSGDLNGNGIADNGDCHLIHVDNAGEVSFDGLVFENGYLSGTAADSYTIQVRPGVFVSGTSSVVNFTNCIFRGNCSEYTSTGVEAGGSGIGVADGKVYITRCSFEKNRASCRGAALRIIGNSAPAVFCDACTFSENGITGQYGGVIMTSNKNALVALNNCTFYKNYVGATGGQSGVAYNGNAPVYIVNCTFVDNMGTSNAKHYQIRTECESGTIFNSIVVYDHTSNTTAGSCDILVNKGSLASAGYLWYGSADGVGTWTGFLTDVSEKTFSDIFAGKELAANGGPVKTIAPAVAVPGATTEDLTAFKRSLSSVFPASWNLLVDARGESRSGTTTAGAYELK